MIWKWLVDNDIFIALSSIGTIIVSVLAVINLKKEKPKFRAFLSANINPIGNNDAKFLLKIYFVSTGYVPISFRNPKLIFRDESCSGIIRSYPEEKLLHKGMSQEIYFDIPSIVNYCNLAFIEIEDSFNKLHRFTKKNIKNIIFLNLSTKKSLIKKYCVGFDKKDNQIIELIKKVR